MKNYEFMKNIILYILPIILILALFAACTKEDARAIRTIPVPESGNYLVFGNQYGACVGDCRELFLLTAENLYQDSDIPNTAELTFNSHPLNAESFKLADTLFHLPTSLISNSVDPNAIIQQIADFDYFIQGRINGDEFKLTYDEIDSTINHELYNYSKLLKNVLSKF